MRLPRPISGLLVVLAAELAVSAEDPPPPVIVALLDTGVEATHPDLAGALLPAINAVSPGKPADDPGAHGTILAGLIVRRSEKPEERGWAADYPVRILPIKVTEDDVAKPATLVVAIDAALREKASVICIAFASPVSTAELDAALDRARQAGAIVVAAAGDVHPDFGGFDSAPAAHPWVVSCTSSKEGPLLLPGRAGVAAGGARGEQVVAGCAATGETELMFPGEATSLRIKGVPDLVKGSSIACARAAALAAVLRASRSDLTAVRIREILVTAGGLPESPGEQATERLRRGSREGVLRWAAKRGVAAGDVFVAGVLRAFAPKGALRLLVEVGNLGDAAMAGRVEVVPPGGGEAIAAEFKEIQPGGRATLSVELEGVDFDEVALVRLVAEGDLNPENNVTRVVCCPPAESGVEIHRLRVTGRRKGSTKATVSARLRSLGGGAREIQIAAGTGEGDGTDRLTLPDGGFVDVEMEFDIPGDGDVTETPFAFSVKSGEAQVALSGAMLNLGPAEFVSQLDRTVFRRRLRR